MDVSEASSVPSAPAEVVCMVGSGNIGDEVTLRFRNVGSGNVADGGEGREGWTSAAGRGGEVLSGLNEGPRSASGEGITPQQSRDQDVDVVGSKMHTCKLLNHEESSLT